MSKKFWLRTHKDPHHDITNAEIIWTIDNFMDLEEENGESILSPSFRIRHGHPGFPGPKVTKWQIQLYPRGDIESTWSGLHFLFGDEVSVFIHSAIGSIEMDPAQVEVSVSILDSSLNRFAEKELKHQAKADKILDNEDTCYGASHFYLRRDLEGDDDDDGDEDKILPGGSLTLSFKLRIDTEDERYIDPTDPKVAKNAKSDSQSEGSKELSEHWGKLHKSKEFCDMEIDCGGKVFPCHKLVMSARSPVFKAMFESKMKESESGKVTIEDIKPEIMTVMLHFIYTSRIAKKNITAEFAIELLAAANKYQLEALKDICQDKIRSFLDAENAIEFLILGEMYQANKLKDAAMMEVVYNMPEIADTEEYQRLVNYPKLVMEIPKAMLK